MPSPLSAPISTGRWGYLRVCLPGHPQNGTVHLTVIHSGHVVLHCRTIGRRNWPTDIPMVIERMNDSKPIPELEKDFDFAMGIYIGWLPTQTAVPYAQEQYNSNPPQQYRQSHSAQRVMPPWVGGRARLGPVPQIPAQIPQAVNVPIPQPQPYGHQNERFIQMGWRPLVFSRNVTAPSQPSPPVSQGQTRESAILIEEDPSVTQPPTAQSPIVALDDKIQAQSSTPPRSGRAPSLPPLPHHLPERMQHLKAYVNSFGRTAQRDWLTSMRSAPLSQQQEYSRYFWCSNEYAAKDLEYVVKHFATFSEAYFERKGVEAQKEIRPGRKDGQSLYWLEVRDATEKKWLEKKRKHDADVRSAKQMCEAKKKEAQRLKKMAAREANKPISLPKRKAASEPQKPSKKAKIMEQKRPRLPTPEPSDAETEAEEEYVEPILQIESSDTTNEVSSPTKLSDELSTEDMQFDKEFLKAFEAEYEENSNEELPKESTPESTQEPQSSSEEDLDMELFGSSVPQTPFISELPSQQNSPSPELPSQQFPFLEGPLTPYSAPQSPLPERNSAPVAEMGKHAKDLRAHLLIANEQQNQEEPSPLEQLDEEIKRLEEKLSKSTNPLFKRRFAPQLEKMRAEREKCEAESDEGVKRWHENELSVMLIRNPA